MWQCVKLIYSENDNGTQEVTHVLVRDLLGKKDYLIKANTVVLAAGAVLTPQILFNSQIRPAALGHYLCFQPKAFCQVLLLQSVVDSIMDRPEWKKMVEHYRVTHPGDPVPIPPDDPLPQVITDESHWSDLQLVYCIRVSKKYNFRPKLETSIPFC